MQRDEISTYILVGDGVLALIKQIDDRTAAETITSHAWDGVERVEATDLERDHVIDRILDERVVRPDGPYNIEHDILADAYRIGYRDGRDRLRR